MTKVEAINQIRWYFEEDDGMAAEGITKEAVNMAIKALEEPSRIEKEPSRIEKELHGKTPEEQLNFLRWLMYHYHLGFTDGQTALIDWLKGESR